MTHQEAYNKITAFIDEAVQINLKMNEPQLAYQKHLLLSFANSLKQKGTDYKKNIEVLLSMIVRSIEINQEYKEYQQADQLQLIYELAKALEAQSASAGTDTPATDLNISLLN